MNKEALEAAIAADTIAAQAVAELEDALSVCIDKRIAADRVVAVSESYIDDYRAVAGQMIARAEKAEAALAAKDAELAAMEKSQMRQAAACGVATARAERAEAQLAEARKALEFYADVSKYPAPLTGGMGALWADCGERARRAREGGSDNG